MISGRIQMPGTERTITLTEIDRDRTQIKQTTNMNSNKPALSSSSKVIAMLNGHLKDLVRWYSTFEVVGCRNDFSDQFRKIIIRYKRIGYNMNVMRQTAWWLTQSGLTTLHTSLDLFRLSDGSGIKLSVKLARAWWSVFGRDHRGSTVWLLLLQRFTVELLLSTRLVSSQW